MKNPITGLFQCESVNHHLGGDQTAILKARREGSGSFSNYARNGSQSGTIEIRITSPEARDSFTPGQIYELTLKKKEPSPSPYPEAQYPSS